MDFDFKMIKNFLFNDNKHLVIFRKNSPSYGASALTTDHSSENINYNRRLILRKYIDINKCRKTYIKTNLDSSCHICDVHIDETFQIEYVLFIRGNELLVSYKKNNQMVTKPISSCFKYCYSVFKKKWRLFCIITARNSIKCHLLYDLDYNLISQIEQNMEFIYFNKENFYFKNNNEIYCYDMSFKSVNNLEFNFQTLDETKPFYLNPLLFYKIVKNNDKLYILDKNKCSVVDSSSGNCLNTIHLGCDSAHMLKLSSNKLFYVEFKVKSTNISEVELDNRCIIEQCSILNGENLKTFGNLNNDYLLFLDDISNDFFYVKK